MIALVRLMKVGIIISPSIGLWHFGHITWLHGKAYVASFLIEDAWQKTLRDHRINKPWSWADTWPVADISIPSIDLNEIVLAGDSGESLAFGPGVSYSGAKLDEQGLKLVSGHRDTHFRQLKNISINDAIFIKTPVALKHYKVKDIGVIDTRDFHLDADSDDYDLVLSTCYPFDALETGTTQRFIVGAVEL